MIKGLITAIRTLSIIPVYGRDAEDFSEAVVWFSFVGFILGIILFFTIKIGCIISNYDMLTALFGVILLSLIHI